MPTKETIYNRKYAARCKSNEFNGNFVYRTDTFLEEYDWERSKDRLTEIEYKSLAYYYGLDGHPQLTQSQIADLRLIDRPETAPITQLKDPSKTGISRQIIAKHIKVGKSKLLLNREFFFSTYDWESSRDNLAVDQVVLFCQAYGLEGRKQLSHSEIFALRKKEQLKEIKSLPVSDRNEKKKQIFSSIIFDLEKNKKLLVLKKEKSLVVA